MSDFPSITIEQARLGGFSSVQLPPAQLGAGGYFEFTPRQSDDTWQLVRKLGLPGLYDMTYSRTNSAFDAALQTVDGVTFARLTKGTEGSPGGGRQTIIATTSDLRMPSGVTGFTLDLLVRPAESSESSLSLDWDNSGLTAQGSIQADFTGTSTLNLGRTLSSDSEGPGFLFRTATVTFGLWHHIRYACDFDSGEEGYALNGTQLGDLASISAGPYLSALGNADRFSVVHNWLSTASSQVDVRLARLWHRALPLSGFTPPS
jgi:hypothetical protein